MTTLCTTIVWMISPYPQLKGPLNLWMKSPYPQLKGPLNVWIVWCAYGVRQSREGVEMGPKRCPAR